jgi:hypothetical protein
MSESWLHRYLRYTEDMESPTVFHEWVALAVAGHVLGRRVWYSKEGTCGIFPGQMMICLVAPSARVRKSTAIRVGAKLLGAIEERTRGRGIVNRIAERGSTQSFLEQMRPTDEMGLPLDDADCVGIIVASELGTYLSTEHWVEQLPAVIADLNDAPTGLWNTELRAFDPTVYRTNFKTKHPLMLRNPCVGMAAATTPIGLAKELPPHAKTAGFFGRVIWVYAEDSDKRLNAMTAADPRTSGLDRDLVEGLLQMTALTGLVGWTRAAREHHEAWYEEHHRRDLRALIDCDLTTGFQGRKQDHVIRVAVILAAMDQSVSRVSGRLVLQLEHLEKAEQLVSQVERQLPLCLKETEARSLVNLQQKILRLTERHPERWITRHRFQTRMWRFHYRTAAVDVALGELVRVGRLRKRGEGVEAEFRYRPQRGAMLRLVREAE